MTYFSILTKKRRANIYFYSIAFLLLALSAYAQDHLRQGFICLQEKQYKEARLHFEQVLEQAPGHLQASLGLAQAYIGMGRFDDAKATLLQAQKYYPNNPRIRLGLGQVYLAQQKFARAIAEFGAARQELPANSTLDAMLAIAHFNMGVTAYQKGRKRQAISEFRESIRLDSTNTRAYQNLAIALLEVNQEEEALLVVEKGLSQDPINRGLLLLQANLLLRNKEFGKLVKTLRILYETNPEDVDIGLKLAYFLRYQNKGDEAVAIYQELHEKFPAKKRIIDEWAQYLLAQKKYDEARGLYNQLLEQQGDKAEFHNAIADIYLSEKNYEGARKEYEKILASFPCHVPTLKNIARTYENEGKLAAACDQYEQALTCANSKLDSADLYGELGRLYEDADPRKAIRAYEQITQLLPDLDFPNIRLGLLYQRAGLDTTAASYFQRAVELSSNDPTPYYRLSEFTLAQGDTMRAKELAMAAVRRGLEQRSEARAQIVGRLQTTDGQISFSELDTLGTISQKVESKLPILRGALELLLRLTPDWRRPQVLQDLWDEFRYDTIVPEYLGQVLESEGLLDEAMQAYTALLKNNVRSKSAHAGLARVYQAKAQIPEAILEYRRVIDIDDQDSTAYDALIRLYDQAGNIENLIEDWELKAKVNPRNTTLLWYLSKLLQKEGKIEEARAVRRRIKEILSSDSK